MARLGRRQPVKPIIINQLAGAQPSLNKLILKGAALLNKARRPVFRTQIINPFKGAQPSQAKLTIKSQIVEQAARRPRFKTQIKNAFAYYAPIPPPIPSRLILRSAVFPRKAFRPATETKIINPAVYPPAPTPPRPVIKTKNQPFVQRDPTQKQPLRRFEEIITIIINSLFGQGILVQTGPTSFTLAGGAGGVISFNGRAGLVNFQLTDLPLSPVAPGNYTFPMVSVDQYGRVTFAASQDPTQNLNFIGPTINGSGPSPITLVVLNGSLGLNKIAPIPAGRILANNQNVSSSPFAVPLSPLVSGLQFIGGVLVGPQTTIANVNGISGTVDLTDASNPIIALALGNITPSSVAASGTVTGSNVSGTNTGDQTITLTGNVTGSGTSSFVATIAGHAVTYAKMQQASATTLLGNSTGGAHDIQEITLGAGLSFSGTTLVATSGSGTVTSVGLSLPAMFTVTVSPVTTTGTLTAVLATQTANFGLFGPTTGAAAAPTFRAMVVADLPGLAFAPASPVVGDSLPFYSLSGATNAETTFAAALALGMRGYIDGCIVTNDSIAPNTTIVVGEGTCADHTNVTIFKFAGFGKNLNSAWAAGAGNGGNLVAGSLATSTWYHIFLIQKASDNSLDVGADTSITCAHIPAGYTNYRRVGSVLTDGSAHILAFHQYGDEFWWDTPFVDVNATNPGTSAVSQSLTVPPSVKVQCIIAGYVYSSTAAISWLVSSLDMADQTPGFANCFESATESEHVSGGAGNFESHIGQQRYWTNTSGQIRTRLSSSDANTSLIIRTLGYRDLRGRDQ